MPRKTASFFRLPSRSAPPALALTTALALLPALVRADEDFLRGDANGDGAASFSDAHFILSYLFRGLASPDCLEAGDVDDDRRLNLTDAVTLLSHVVLGGPAPCDPFPAMGPDRTEDDMPCETYGGGEPFDDSAARLEVEAAEATGDGRVQLTVRVSNSTPIGGFHGVVSAAGGVFADGSEGTVADRTGAQPGYIAARVVGGKLHFGYLKSLHRRAEWLVPGSDVAVIDIVACLATGTKAGEYALTLESGELADFDTGRAIPPALAGDTLVVSADLAGGCPHEPVTAEPPACRDPDPPPPPPPPPGPEDGAPFVRGDANADGKISVSDAAMLRLFLFAGERAPSCWDSGDADDKGNINLTDVVYLMNALFGDGPVPPAPQGSPSLDPTPDALSCASFEVVAAAETADVIRIGDVSGAPGEKVLIPVYLTNSVPIGAFQLVIEYGPDFIAPFHPEDPADIIRLDGETFYQDPPLGYAAIGRPDASQEVISIGIIADLRYSLRDVPPGEDRLVFKIVGKISDTAQPGTVIQLIPTNGPDGQGFGPYGLVNELTHQGDARYLSTVPQLEPGLLAIVGDQTVFIRGDSNRDARLNVSDAVHTLRSLFQAGGPLTCADAADANDSGSVDLADAVFTLAFLFQRGKPLPPPFPAAAPDPTADSLVCFPKAP